MEQKLEMQQIKQQCEDKETEMIIRLKEKDAKIEELTHLLNDERTKVLLSGRIGRGNILTSSYQRERAESKSVGLKSPEAKDSSTFSYFKSKMAGIFSSLLKIIQAEMGGGAELNMLGRVVGIMEVIQEILNTRITTACCHCRMRPLAMRT